MLGHHSRFSLLEFPRRHRIGAAKKEIESPVPASTFRARHAGTRAMPVSSRMHARQKPPAVPMTGTNGVLDPATNDPAEAKVSGASRILTWLYPERRWAGAHLPLDRNPPGPAPQQTS